MPEESAHQHEEATTEVAGLNWLEAHEQGEKWKRVKFRFGKDDPRPEPEKVRERKRMVEALLRGWLEIYNREENRNHQLVDFDIRKRVDSDTEYTVRAVIDPPQEQRLEGGNGHNNGGGQGGSHLVPHPPPPPDDTFGL